MLLSKAGKREFIPAWVAMMQEPTLLNGKKIKRKEEPPRNTQEVKQARLTALAQVLMERGREGGGA